MNGSLQVFETTLELSPKRGAVEHFPTDLPTVFNDAESPRNGASESIQRGLAAILSTLVTARMTEG